MRKLSPSIFPYRTDTHGNTFPIIPITLEFADKKREFYALVDSGATMSVFRGEVADIFKINVESGEKIYLGGVGGRIKGYVHKLRVEVGGQQFVCPIVFSYEYLVSINLLGREEFFKRFQITFEEKKNRLKLG